MNSVKHLKTPRGKVHFLSWNEALTPLIKIVLLSKIFIAESLLVGFYYNCSRYLIVIGKNDLLYE
tara:strand:- start:419 stop:613 length:195 start_codon:yes stop_codon:yes gene_type:complete